MKISALTIRKILATLGLLMIVLPVMAFAQADPGGAPANPTGTSGSTAPANQDAGVSESELLYRFQYTNSTSGTTKIDAVNRLPQKDWKATLAGVIKMLLNISGGLTLLSFTVGGVMMVVSQGSGDLLEKGKRITWYSVIGLIIIAVSYALVIGVSEFQFFTPGAGGGGTQQNSTTTPAPASKPMSNPNTK
jgi:hypothetical protein